MNSEDIVAYLEGENISLPPEFKPGREPTPKALRQVLDSFKDYQVEYRVGQHNDGTHNWQATIEHLDPIDNQSVLISSVDYSGDENLPISIYFQGSEFMNSILQELTLHCGWITLITGSNLKEVAFFSPSQNQ